MCFSGPIVQWFRAIPRDFIDRLPTSLCYEHRCRPFYIVASYAIVYQKNWIRIPAVVWAGMMLGALPPVFLQELFGYSAEFPDHPSQTFIGKAAFLAGYGGFLVVPVIVIMRMWSEPFPKRE